MTGTIVNAAAIFLAGALALLLRRQISPANQNLLKVGLGLATMIIGFYLLWQGVQGSFLHIFRNFFVVLVALSLGTWIGKLLRLQKGSNRLGQHARELMNQAGGATGKKRFHQGFVTGTILFCLAPMAVLGAVQEGLTGNFSTLVVKAVMDGLSSMAFVAIFGWGVLVSALPVLAFQGTLTLLTMALADRLGQPEWLDASLGAAGVILVAVSLVILEVRKIELANFLPALIIAPLLQWLLVG